MSRAGRGRLTQRTQRAGGDRRADGRSWRAPDIAGFYDLAHAFDLEASAIAARATLETALIRRETRGCHNRSDYPHLDDGLNVNLVWSEPGRVEREAIPGIPQDISARMREVSTHGKLVE